MRVLIDKENTVDLILKRSREVRGTYGDLGSACTDVAKLVENMVPAAENIRKGQWKHIEFTEVPFYCRWGKCSCCHGLVVSGNYCPNCGAKLVVKD